MDVKTIEDTAKQGVPQYDGLYVHGEVYGVSVMFTVDTALPPVA